jgi:hypothetical protein
MISFPSLVVLLKTGLTLLNLLQRHRSRIGIHRDDSLDYRRSHLESLARRAILQ